MNHSLLDAEIRTARILIVDDVEANVMMLTDLLEAGGYINVFGTTDPKAGLAEIAAKPCDLLLLDMRMPEIDGLEFIKRLEALPATIRPAILALTAQTDDETRRLALAAGVRDFVTKPFLIWELLHRIRNTLEIQILFRQSRDLNDVLEAKVQERTRELNETRIEVIRRLATAAEFRDNETGMHVVRMSVFAYHLALAAGLPEAEAAAIRDAAPLHDVGKIGIPDAILLKPGKFDPPEWEIMKRHAEIGGEMLSGSTFPLLDLARIIAMTHHEKWDGTGYPSGLRAETIPIAGRIVAIADVFDALTSERPYKKVWTIEQAVDHLKHIAGSHLDPALVELFCLELPAILRLREQFGDSPARDA